MRTSMRLQGDKGLRTLDSYQISAACILKKHLI